MFGCLAGDSSLVTDGHLLPICHGPVLERKHWDACPVGSAHHPAAEDPLLHLLSPPAAARLPPARIVQACFFGQPNMPRLEKESVDYQWPGWLYLLNPFLLKVMFAAASPRPIGFK